MDLEEGECSSRPWRASDKALVPMSVEDYLKLVRFANEKFLQGFSAGGNYPHVMTAHESQPGSNGQPIDWGVELERHRRWLRTVVFARLGERRGTEDVLQEVAVAALEQKAPLQHAERVSAWLYQLAVRQSLQYRRKQGRERRRIKGWVRQSRPSESDSASPDPLGWLLADERQRLVREALFRLGGEDREILLLKYTEDWSYRELAGRLGVRTSAIESRLHRARQRLRHQLTLLNMTEREP